MPRSDQHPQLHRLGTVVLTTLLGLALIAAAAIVALFAVSVWGPHDTAISTLSNVLVWPTLGPWVVVTGLVALIAGAVGLLRSAPRRTAALTTALALLAVVVSIIPTAQIASAAASNGGSVNVFQGLALASMNGAQPDRTETFQNADGESLPIDVYEPAGGPVGAPVIMYIHGGGFAIGTRDETAADLRWFADQGWLVLSPSYRLATEQDATWEKAPQDVACALTWTSENAQRLGGDPSSLALLGDSAGGNLATNLAYSASEGIAPSGCGTVPVPAALVIQYPEVDIAATRDAFLVSPDDDPSKFVQWYIGGTQEEFPERVKDISSQTYLTAAAPPTLLIEPQNDGIILTDAVMGWADQAQLIGVDLTVAKIPFASHVYNQQFYNSIGNQARRTITEHYLNTQGLAPAR